MFEFVVIGHFYRDWYSKESLQFFFIGVSDAPKYNITWTENVNVIDRFIPKIIKSLIVLSQYFCNEATNHIAVFSPNNVILSNIILENRF